MKRLVIIIFSIAILTGCAVKEEINIFAKDKPYVEALRYTKKGDIVLSLENKAMIIATYLNPLQKRNDKEYFFMRVYIDNDFEDPKKSGLFNPDYTLTLNGHKPLTIKEVESDSKLAKTMPFVQKWYRLYLVTFPKSKGKKLQLIFKNRNYPPAVVTFERYEVD
ncbi:MULTISPECIES: hypothetical protein [unclassified Nitratiruptor]|uniref:hypothetical protein n=1 Tax=unclassified Nitratiruptor TaxID=2624044 RepID=UPI00191627CC|nr:MULTISPECIES: hypothetical protein [unclassified Nitratiruptor]